ncbi:hypothetical protein CH063_14394 [Colletotrichum higginsianum]|uniref:Uncharacterized protein n=1 Tax=Colletotrichum higginsianum (strain IMI 349063) TaxID=759273 RepID=H1VYE4_COLHI|nr:hypothetical protein CH63R_13492 [Colletotrichum higginsianum IMI 349063]OBR02266.1 hypothetical protein CH63R_13492 [Colletotrichum higginsianum IMI 349063]CCF45256.1 hypothetical protein CH063_14394 [Colletotrichum higginsianum]
MPPPRQSISSSLLIYGGNPQFELNSHCFQLGLLRSYRYTICSHKMACTTSCIVWPAERDSGFKQTMVLSQVCSRVNAASQARAPDAVAGPGLCLRRRPADSGDGK